MKTESVIDVAEQVQTDREKLSPGQQKDYKICMAKIRAAVAEHPEMSIGVIFEVAGQMVCMHENSHIN